MTDPKSPKTSLSTRRQFLTRSAALAGAGGILSACESMGSPIPRRIARPHAGPDEAVRIGVIGTGGMGMGHIRSLLALHEKGADKIQIAAVCDVCDSRLEQAAKTCDEKQAEKTKTYRDYRELLAQEDLHGVLIATPEHWHAPMCEEAIAVGLDAYVEKPMTLRLPEALRLHEVAKANPEAIVQIGTQFIMRPKYVHAKRLLAENAIGKPTSSQTSYCRNSTGGEWNYYGIDENWEPGVNLDWDAWCGPLGKQPWDPVVYARWRRYRKYSTGILGDLLVHVMTPLVFSLDQGWPTRVVACGGNYVDKEMENHDQVNLTVQFEKEHTMIVAGSTCNEMGLETLIRGHEASIYLGGVDCVVRPERPFAEEIDEQTIQCKSVPDQDNLRLDWIKCMRTREPNLSPVELGTKVMVIVDLATRSMWEGNAFEFDPKTMTARAV